MKLENINRLNEAMELSRQNAIIEGILSDFVASKVSQFQTWVAGHDKEVEHLGLSGFIKAAKNLDVSLLDDLPEADEWWQSVAIAIDKRQGGQATKRQRAAIIAKAKAKIDLVINRDLEDTRSRLEELISTRGSNANVDKLFSILFGGRAKPRKKARRAYAESRINEGFGQTISNALDMLDPQKRLKLGSALIRSSNNARIASIAIPLIANKLDVLRVGRTFKTVKKPPVPSTPLTRKYEMAMFINKCMADSSKGKYKDKDEEYWLERIRAKAKRMGMKIDIPKLPTQPYPKDFAEFRQKYNP